MAAMTETSSTFEKNAQTVQAWWNDLQLALVFLTRLPWQLQGDIPPQALNRALRAFPLVGLLIGGLSATVYGLAHLFGLPPLAGALLAVLCSVLVSGALHEDGLADVADGFGGGLNKERKLEIMRDSTVGSYGALALIFSIALRTAALAGLSDPMIGGSILIAVACLSRSSFAVVLYLLDPARKDGVAATMEKPAPSIVVQALAVGGAVFLFCLSFKAGLLTLLLCGAVLYGFINLSRRQIGGHSGDVCGAAQQVVEITALLCLSGLASLS